MDEDPRRHKAEMGHEKYGAGLIFGTNPTNFVLFATVPPKIQPLADSRVILEGVPLILPCEVTGSPIPQIVWHKMVSEDTSVDVTKLVSNHRFILYVYQTC